MSKEKEMEGRDFVSRERGYSAEFTTQGKDEKMQFMSRVRRESWRGGKGGRGRRETRL